MPVTNTFRGHKIGISPVVLIGAREFYDVERANSLTLFPVIRALNYRSSFVRSH